jgi:16S rRNA (guanine527-N7)-methyltransferase
VSTDGPEALAAAGLTVSRESLERLVAFTGLVRDWQRIKNLVGPSTLAELWTRHVADSVQLAGLAPLDGTWADLGSGAGFPGLVIAILMADAPGDGVVHLVESNLRKAAFLREAARRIGACATVHAERAEGVLPALGKVDVVTARAFAPLVSLLEYAQPLVEKGALALLPKGQDVEAELTEASRYWKFDYERLPSRTNPAAVILRVRAIERRP